MAEGIRNVCKHCGRAVESWSDGNPYYIDVKGKKRYAYHPDHELLDLCIGNDSPHLCLNCGKKCMVDSERPIKKCRKCGSVELADTFHLAGKRCPFCKAGEFVLDEGSHAIS